MGRRERSSDGSATILSSVAWVRATISYFGERFRGWQYTLVYSSIPHTAKTIATSIVHSKLDYCNSLPKHQINRLQHNALVRTVVQASKFQHITPILKSLHWLKVSERIEYKIIYLTKLSILLSHRISMTLYLFSHLMVITQLTHVLHLWSNHHHRSKSLTAPSDMLHLIFGISFLHHSEFLIQIIHPPLSDLHLNMPV